LRARYSTLEARRSSWRTWSATSCFSQEAIRQGYDKSPAVREQMKRAMIQELIKRQLDAKLSGSDIPDEELKKFTRRTSTEFVKPERARVLHIFLPATDAKQRAEARKHAATLLKDIDGTREEGEVKCFQSVAMKGARTRSLRRWRDLRFLSKDELAKAYNPELASAAFDLKNPGDKAGPLDTPPASNW